MKRQSDESREQLLEELEEAKRKISLLETEVKKNLGQDAKTVISESEEKYRTLVEVTNTGYLIIDSQGAVIDANQEYVRLTGHKDLSEIIGRSVIEWTAEHDLERNKLEVQKCFENGFVRDLVIDYVDKSGELTPIEVNANVIEKDGLTQVLALCRDITDRKQAEAALKESEEKYRTLVESSIQGVTIAQSSPLRMSFANQALAKLSGYDVSELLEMGPGELLELLHPEDREIFFRRFFKRITGDEVPTRQEYRIVRKDGSIAWVQNHSTFIEFLGEPAVLGTFVDITERKLAGIEKQELEKKLRASQKMEAIGRLAGGVAHDFNNMLCAISGNLSMIFEDLPVESQFHRQLEEISKASERAAGLTRQLLAFSRKQVIEPKVIDLNALVLDIQNMLVRLIGEDIIFRTSLQKDLGLVLIDPGQVEQIVINLVINARDAMPQGGKLVIETRNIYLDESYCRAHALSSPGNYVEIATSDTGTGIETEIMEKIFEPFFTTKQFGQGTGLGLSTVFGIVEQNKGSIEVYSEQGKGSTFKVFFPQVQGVPDVSTPTSMPEPMGGKETVLVVEDEEIVRNIAEKLLKHLGYNVMTSDSASKAISMAEKYDATIDLLFTDLIMPHMNGRDLATKILESRPGIKVLFASGYTHNIISQHALLEEGLNFISKPYSINSLATRIREVLDR